jgi:hypothetical protein
MSLMDGLADEDEGLGIAISVFPGFVSELQPIRAAIHLGLELIPVTPALDDERASRSRPTRMLPS